MNFEKMKSYPNYHPGFNYENVIEKLRNKFKKT